MGRDVKFALAIGPATRDQLEQWAVEYDRTWAREDRIGRVFFAAGVIVCVGLAGVLLVRGFSGVGMWEGVQFGVRGLMLSLLGVVACLLAIRVMWALYEHHFTARQNPYRPIDVTPADLVGRNATFPGALAYLDAIRHQRRPIVPYDLDVMGLIRRQQQFNPGA
ncbi:hypothetical protein [Burkholderia cenocepacia]|uniref:hypothetical protein n=1 Tax=Burkholderia cenocepacia TaxID=95486 RepID=UPI002B2538AB|nr:hypothetical protein [Burkholderia cenocepacia]MEB2558779.1 hypothetical protein [Burkholderia cenocepacia]